MVGLMATWEDVRRLVMELPEVVEDEARGNLAWRVRKKLVAWERPLRTSDLTALGIEPPEDPILAVRTPSVGDKEALVAAEPEIYFTTPHFNGFPAVLVWLDRIDGDELAELLIEAWVTQAPKRLSKEFLAGLDGDISQG